MDIKKIVLLVAVSGFLPISLAAQDDMYFRPQKTDKKDVLRDEDVDYQVGDYVVHDTFGAGRVVEVTNSLVSVAFKHPYGIKKLMKNHKSLTKV